jgi:hypothetical protein
VNILHYIFSRKWIWSIAAIGSFSLVPAVALVPAVQAIALDSPQAEEQSSTLSEGNSAEEQLIAQQAFCPGGVPVASYRTATYAISICMDDDDRLYYRGYELENSTNRITVTDVDAVAYGAYYASSDGTTGYYIDSENLIVYQNGEAIWKEPVLSWTNDKDLL